MNVKVNNNSESIHCLARFLYWISLLLLLGGMWLMIDPYNRKAGQTGHVYITLAAFELYIWLMLLLARWQGQKLLVSDTARSGIFAAVLVGLQFMVLNELYMASAKEAYFISTLMVGLTAAKLIAARQWLGISLPGPVLVFCLGWVVCLALPAPVIKLFESDKSAQHGLAYLSCWLIALLVAGHMGLIRWQMRRYNYFDSSILGQWWSGWLLLVIFAGLAFVQLYAVMWGLFVEWAQWYFSPICLAVGVVVVLMAHTAGHKIRDAWLIFLLAVMHTAIAGQEPLPREFPAAWLQGWGGYLVHPVYPSGLFVTLLFAVGGLLICRLWLYGFAAAFPLGFSMVKGAYLMWRWPRGKGLALLLGAFLLLAAGALIQWWQLRWGDHRRAVISCADENSAGAVNLDDIEDDDIGENYEENIDRE